MNKIKKAAIMGSGVMGSAIAAHFANVGIPSLLLDLPAKEGNDPNAASNAGLKGALKAKPAPFYLLENASLIETGNFENDLEKIKECDLILEVIIELMPVKKELLKKLDKVRGWGSIVASNTSGLSVNEMVSECSEDLQKNFVGMHFFNPPRYLKLLEIIPTKQTRKEVIDFVSDFGENILGKGIVVCRDTPNFIANRIGMYSIMSSMKIMADAGYSVQEVDAFTGANIGHAKSATFRTADLVGLDTLVHVARNLYDSLPGDDERDIFRVPDFLQKLVDSKALGSKTGRGFYLKTAEKEIKHLDYKTGEYLSREKLTLASIGAARAEDTVTGKIKAMISGKDRASEFLCKNFYSVFIYCAKRLGEIAGTIVEIDNAMKWGFGWEIGPFGKWDILGVEKTVAKMRELGKSIPGNIEEFLKQGNKTFYKTEKGVDCYYDFREKSYKEIQRSPKVLILKNIKEQDKTISANSGASLIDLGDGIACLEFHSKMNAIGGEIISMARKAVEEVEKNYRGLVIANQGPHFSAGANIMLMLMAIMEEEWDEIDLIIRQFQKMTMGFRYSSKPVVAAPFGMALGGGCEVVLHADQVIAGAESYLGLVEAGVGLIPAGGGSKEMTLRAMTSSPDDSLLLHYLKRIFETIAMAKVSTSAHEARNLWFLKESDRIIINGDHLIHCAKQAAIGLYESGYRESMPRNDIPVMGRSGMAAIKLFTSGFREGGYISEHDEVVALKLGHILTGGNISGKQKVSEQYLLDLEREAFLSLCGMRKTQERIKHMLEKGKPLRN
ncbi:MAG: 3-hydroxyacyl-CoA dehydrogenase NAD-binding domain-containing protein [bacterium]